MPPRIIAILLICLLPTLAHARTPQPIAPQPITLKDDAGRTVTLPAAAQRIVSLAPHITEILFNAGAGDRIVGTVEYSDYPEAAKQIPQVGGYDRVNFEYILMLQPDVIIAWHTGNHPDTLQKLGTLKVPVYLSEPKDLQAIAHNIRQMGILTGTETSANAAAEHFEQQWAALEKANAGKPEVSLFYQVWEEPLYTLGNGHFSRALFRLCGGRNIFDDLADPSPVITVEAVITRNPQVMLTGGHHGERDFDDWRNNWIAWQSIDAVKHNQMYMVDQDIYIRSSPRAIQGAADLCVLLDKARAIYYSATP